MTAKILTARTDIEPVETGLEDSGRKKLAAHLSLVLADTIILMIKTQVYHWNVVGPLFVPIHELTEKQYRDMFEAADDIAERIRELGYPAPVSFTDLVPKASVFEETNIRSAQGMVEQLISDHEKIVRGLRDSAEIAEQLRDFVTHDLMTERLSFHEKAIWMLRSIVSE